MYPASISSTSAIKVFAVFLVSSMETSNEVSLQANGKFIEFIAVPFLSCCVSSNPFLFNPFLGKKCLVNLRVIPVFLKSSKS